MKRQRSMIRIMSSIAVDTNIKLDNEIPASMKGAALLITGGTGSFGNAVPLALQKLKGALAVLFKTTNQHFFHRHYCQP